jgi:hypothetical protein
LPCIIIYTCCSVVGSALGLHLQLLCCCSIVDHALGLHHDLHLPSHTAANTHAVRASAFGLNLHLPLTKLQLSRLSACPAS